MGKHITISLIVICIVLASSAANASDYKDWIPLLPASIGAMEKQGDPKGMNMDTGGDSWSSLKQDYSNAEGNHISLTLFTGSNAPGLRKFKNMKSVNLDTGERKVKTLDLAGYKAVLDLNKQGGKSKLFILARDETIIIIGTNSFDTEKALKSLTDDVPITDIAASVE